MTFMICSEKSNENRASLSFSGSHLRNFGFNAGCKVSVDISKGKIIITLLDGKEPVTINNNCIERIDLYD